MVLRFSGDCPFAVPAGDLLYKVVSGSVGSPTISMERVANSAHKAKFELVGGLELTPNFHGRGTYRLIGYEFDGVRFVLNDAGTGFRLVPETSSANCKCIDANPANVLIRPANGYVPGNDFSYAPGMFLARVKATSETRISTFQASVLPDGCYQGVSMDIELPLFAGGPAVIDGYWVSSGRPGMRWIGSTPIIPAIGHGVFGQVAAFGMESESEPEVYGPAGLVAITHEAWVQTSFGQWCWGYCELGWNSHTSALSAYTGTLSCAGLIAPNDPTKTFESSVSGSGV